MNLHDAFPRQIVLAALMLGAAAQAAVHITPADSCDIPGFRERALALVNEARAAPRQCGKAGMEAVAPVQWNDSLFLAAAAHSRDMAQRDYFDHASPEGGRVGARATAEGYRWRMIGENIAGGDRKLEGVMAGWLHSEGHCHNIMRTEFTDFALACVHRDGTTWGTYWTMVLGRPQVRARP